MTNSKGFCHCDLKLHYPCKEKWNYRLLAKKSETTSSWQRKDWAYQLQAKRTKTSGSWQRGLKLHTFAKMTKPIGFFQHCLKLLYRILVLRTKFHPSCKEVWTTNSLKILLSLSLFLQGELFMFLAKRTETIRSLQIKLSLSQSLQGALKLHAPCN